jgi:hypothetical protein
VTQQIWLQKYEAGCRNIITEFDSQEASRFPEHGIKCYFYPHFPLISELGDLKKENWLCSFKHFVKLMRVLIFLDKQGLLFLGSSSYSTIPQKVI